MTQGLSPVTHNILASSTATLAAEIITLPICTIKTVYQNNHDKSIKQSVSYIYQRNGLFGFYRASSPAIVSQMVSMTFKYTLYRHFVDKISPTTPQSGNSVWHRMKSGLFSGMLSSIFTHPIDVWRSIYQNQQILSDHLTGYVRSTEAKWYSSNKITLAYRGYTKTLGKTAIGSITFMPLFDTIKHHLSRGTEVSDNKIYNTILASSLTASIATPICHIPDYLKIRHTSGTDPYHNISKNIFRGLSLNLLRVIPHFTIVMTIIESCKR